ncbi:hypothetical protein DYB38_002590, partial [Aphanomyces astaci]
MYFRPWVALLIASAASRTYAVDLFSRLDEAIAQVPDDTLLTVVPSLLQAEGTLMNLPPSLEAHVVVEDAGGKPETYIYVNYTYHDGVVPLDENAAFEAVVKCTDHSLRLKLNQCATLPFGPGQVLIHKGLKCDGQADYALGVRVLSVDIVEMEPAPSTSCDLHLTTEQVAGSDIFANQEFRVVTRAFKNLVEDTADKQAVMATTTIAPAMSRRRELNWMQTKTNDLLDMAWNVASSKYQSIVHEMPIYSSDGCIIKCRDCYVGFNVASIDSSFSITDLLKMEVTVTGHVRLAFVLNAPDMCKKRITLPLIGTGRPVGFSIDTSFGSLEYASELGVEFVIDLQASTSSEYVYVYDARIDAFTFGMSYLGGPFSKRQITTTSDTTWPDWLKVNGQVGLRPVISANATASVSLWFFSKSASVVASAALEMYIRASMKVTTSAALPLPALSTAALDSTSLVKGGVCNIPHVFEYDVFVGTVAKINVNICGSDYVDKVLFFWEKSIISGCWATFPSAPIPVTTTTTLAPPITTTTTVPPSVATTTTLSPVTNSPSLGGDRIDYTFVAPDTYPPNANVFWSFECSSSTSFVSVTFTQFDLERNYDFVEISLDGGKFTGNAIPPGPIIVNVDAKVHFTSDSTQGQSGFVLEYTCIFPDTTPSPTTTTPSPTTTTLSPTTTTTVAPTTTTTTAPPTPTVAARGTIDYSFVDPLTYEDNKDVRWNFTCPSESLLVNVTFTKLDLEDTYDFVRITGGFGWNFTGRLLPTEPITVPANAEVRFTSDGSQGRTGFVLNYVCLSTFPLTTPAPSSRSGRIDYSFTSPAVYDNSVQLHWPFVCPSNETSVNVTFVQLDVETNFDFVFLGGTSNRYTGNVVPLGNVILGADAQVYFTSDRSIGGSGFVLDYECFSIVVPPIVDDATHAGVVGSNTTVQNGTVRIDYSFAAPLTYANNLNVTWQLVCSSTEETLVSVTFALVDLETNFDVIRIGSPVAATITGNTSPAPFVVAANSMMAFTSDGSVGRSGFILDYTCHTGAWLDPVMTTNNSTSPSNQTNSTADRAIDYSFEPPSVYANNVNRNWTLTCPSNTPVATVVFSKLDVENNFDFVTIGGFGGGRFTGTVLPPVVVTSGNASVVFTSDASVGRTGFALVYDCLADRLATAANTTTTTTTQPASPSAPASVIINVTSDVIDFSVEPPNTYGPNLNKSWVLACPPLASHVIVILTKLGLENGFDYLRFSGYNFTGNVLPSPFNVDANSTVWLTSDGSIGGIGFTLNYTCTAAVAPEALVPTMAPNAPSPSGGRRIDYSFVYPNVYGDNLNLNWILSCPSNASSLVTVTFTTFDLEIGYDYLTVPGAGRFTGNLLPPTATVSAGTVIVFVTDGSAGRAGFTLDYVCSGATTTPIPTLAPSVGTAMTFTGRIDYTFLSPIVYGNNLNLTWVLTCPSSSLVLVNVSFSTFDLESGYDFVTFPGVARYTGSSLPSISNLAANSSSDAYPNVPIIIHHDDSCDDVDGSNHHTIAINNDNSSTINLTSYNPQPSAVPSFINVSPFTTDNKPRNHDQYAITNKEYAITNKECSWGVAWMAAISFVSVVKAVNAKVNPNDLKTLLTTFVNKFTTR